MKAQRIEVVRSGWFVRVRHAAIMRRLRARSRLRPPHKTATKHRAKHRRDDMKGCGTCGHPDPENDPKGCWCQRPETA